MPHSHDPASDSHAQPSGVRAVPRGREVRVARINRKVLLWTAAVVTVVVALSFVSIIIHGLVLTGKW